MIQSVAYTQPQPHTHTCLPANSNFKSLVLCSELLLSVKYILFSLKKFINDFTKVLTAYMNMGEECGTFLSQKLWHQNASQFCTRKRFSMGYVGKFKFICLCRRNQSEINSSLCVTQKGTFYLLY